MPVNSGLAGRTYEPVNRLARFTDVVLPGSGIEAVVRDDSDGGSPFESITAGGSMALSVIVGVL